MLRKCNALGLCITCHWSVYIHIYTRVYASMCIYMCVCVCVCVCFFFTFTWPCIVTNFFIIKSTRCTNFTNLFWHETLHVSDSSSVHHQEFHCMSTLSNGVCHTGFVDSFRAGPGWNSVPSWSCSKAVYKPVWHIPLLSVQWMNSWWWTEELSETCRVSFQNKFVKLVHLVGFIIKIYIHMCVCVCEAVSYQRETYGFCRGLAERS